MIDGKLLIEKLLVYAKAHLRLNARDEIYFRNLLLREFNLDQPTYESVDENKIINMSVPDELVKEIEEYALENGIIKDGEQDLYSTYIMGMLSPLPSKVNEEFLKIKESEGIEKACDYLFDLSIKNNYVRKTAIEKNLKWSCQDGDKYIEVTVNLSKPEKDNKEIAKLLTAKKSTNYPSCLLCKENEGYQGTLTHPARENIRTISLALGGEKWFVQYSPYAYYEEHMIAISEKHSPMHIEEDTVDKILDFVDFFPNYMIGSNAALPIIGGSILNHEHFQGGKHLMPMHNAVVEQKFTAKDYPEVEVGKVDWYNSVIRLESKNRKQIKELATVIINEWKKFSEKDCEILAFTDKTPHNSLSPVCRKQGDKYIIDIILRNNRVDERYPDGIFHAHPEYHNIKKEGIGLIEAMGLFILPGRLKKQLKMIAEILCGQAEYDEAKLNDPENYLFAHRNMIKELLSDGKEKDIALAEKRVTDKVNDVCKNILYNTAVFKNDENGRKGFVKFLNKCNIR